MGLGFCHSMIPILKKLYPDDKEKRAEGMSRHLTYYNTENTWGCLIPGIVAAQQGELVKQREEQERVFAGENGGELVPHRRLQAVQLLPERLKLAVGRVPVQIGSQFF